MILFSLTCDSSHQFESWFPSGEAFDKLQKSGMLTCAECGSKAVRKDLMAPIVLQRPERDAGKEAAAAKAQPPSQPLSQPASALEAKLAELRRHVEENSEYVGMNFAAEARAMHDGDSPVRAIYGEARAEEARAMLEDGVPVAPLPFIPRSKVN
ncbi:MAG: DUF1178 family protein [Paracoccaceae bacterium]